MSRILITGATGFVGRALAAELRKAGHLLSGTTRRPNLGQGPSDVPLYQIGEMGPDTDWSTAISGAEIVVHLAARVHVMKETSNQSLALFRATNTDGTRRLAETAARAGVRRFIFLSTVKVMGEETAGAPFKETDSAMPSDAYAISKWDAEQALTDISVRAGMEAIILRPPLAYGPHVRGNFLSLLKICARGFPLPLASINNTRSLLSVGNLASAIATAAAHPAAANGAYLLSDGEDLSTPDLIRRTAHALGRKARLYQLPIPLLEAAGALIGRREAIKRLTGSLSVDSAKFAATFGWRPRQSVDEGLAETADWFLNSRNFN
ncbi:MAG: NAD-dependent epimerase/dehydratase family protein [Rhodospirillales bacterium]|nr:NAD-dependent epimerase/dehydratase family protein [Rhodospirillales bacterium]